MPGSVVSTLAIKSVIEFEAAGALVPMCRICGASKAVQEIGRVPLPAASTDLALYRCRRCGSHFTDHDDRAAENLHADDHSVYHLQSQIADVASSLYEARDVTGLGNYLRQLRKNAFVMDEIEATPGLRRVMEVGCSRGYMTAYFVLRGYDVVGVDVSKTALESAIGRIGPYFAAPDDPKVAAGRPYDAIYHVGTIGCVGDPFGFTRGLLDQLRPGGVLLFNAPNLNACVERGRAWSQEVFPPDVVTLFSPEIWTNNFSDIATVNVTERRLARREQVRKALRPLRGSRSKNGVDLFSAIRAVVRPDIDEFGMFVRMTRL